MGNFSLMLALLCWVALSASLFQTVTVRPDEGVTLRCANLSRIAGHIFWFKLNDGPDVSRISSMSTSEAVPSLHGEFQRGKFTMRSNVTNIFLDIKQVEVTDSGLYFCGFYAEDFPGVFAATYLHVEGKIVIPLIFLAMVIINLVVKIRTLNAHIKPTVLRVVVVFSNQFETNDIFPQLNPFSEREPCVLYAATR
uniref:Immunoglobulin domain-containing protein n=1 Tax=Xiphophorus maculatus TaxID=8083 RepID=A0A3B5R974_XIPMA